MDITPDTKDWTWVLQRECPECGFDARSVARQEVAGLIRGNAESWREVFAGCARFTVDTFARYLVHDPIHHLYDVTRTC